MAAVVPNDQRSEEEKKAAQLNQQAYNIVLNDDVPLTELDTIHKAVEEQGGSVVDISRLTMSLTVTFHKGEKPSVLNDTDKYTVEKNEEVTAKCCCWPPPCQPIPYPYGGYGGHWHPYGC